MNPRRLDLLCIAIVLLAGASRSHASKESLYAEMSEWYPGDGHVHTMYSWMDWEYVRPWPPPSPQPTPQEMADSASSKGLKWIVLADHQMMFDQTDFAERHSYVQSWMADSDNQDSSGRPLVLIVDGEEFGYTPLSFPLSGNLSESMEIQFRDGHYLAWDSDWYSSSDCTCQGMIDSARDAGASIGVIAHPYRNRWTDFFAWESWSATGYTAVELINGGEAQEYALLGAIPGYGDQSQWDMHLTADSSWAASGSLPDDGTRHVGVANSDAHTPDGVGSGRTYVHITDSLTVASLMGAVKNGMCVASSGARLVICRVNDVGIGSIAQLATGCNPTIEVAWSSASGPPNSIHVVGQYGSILHTFSSSDIASGTEGTKGYLSAELPAPYAIGYARVVAKFGGSPERYVFTNPVWIKMGNYGVAMPQFGPDGGSYDAAQTVRISCSTADASIHYTMDNSDPTDSSPTIASGGTLSLSSNVTLNARAFKSGLSPSPIKRAVYRFQVKPPRFSPDGGTFNADQPVTIWCATPGAVIHYTTNDAEPGVSDPVVASGSSVTVDRCMTLKAKAFKSGWDASETKSAYYEMVVATPSFTPNGGDYELPQAVVLDSQTPRCVIHYLASRSSDYEELDTTCPSVDAGGSVVLSRSCWLKAKGFRDGWVTSGVVISQAYHFPVRVNTSAVGPEDGTTWPSAYRTIEAGFNAAIAGDQIWVARGAYTQCVYMRPDNRLYGGFAAIEATLAQRPAFPRPLPDPNETVIDAARQGSGISFDDWDAEADILIDGFTVKDGAPMSDGQTTSHGGGVFCRSKGNINVINCRLIGNFAATGAGVTADAAGQVLVGNNEIRGNVGASALEVSSTSSCCIRNNVIVENSGNGVLYEDMGDNMTILIANNTIVGNGLAGIMVNSSATGVFANNIVAYNMLGINDIDHDGTQLTLYRNCVYGNGLHFDPQFYHPRGMEWNPNYLFLSPGSDDIQADPKLVSAECGRFQLRADSPCINAGTNVHAGQLAHDMDGEPRIQEGVIDIGADEYGGNVEDFSPLIVRVSQQGDDANEGASWTEPKRSIQAALDAVHQHGGGEVWVAEGLYEECVTVLAHESIYGGFSGHELTRSERDRLTHSSLIDGGRHGSVVTLVGATPLASIDGLVIRNGSTSASGGGMNCLLSSPVVRDNLIEDNTAGEFGGGIANKYSAPVFCGNTIRGNGARYGGGLSIIDSLGLVLQNDITLNIAVNGAGSYCDGYDTEEGPSFVGNTISVNSASGRGGGIASRLSTWLRLNRIDGNSSGTDGGGLYLSGQECMELDTNMITNNTADGSGGGIYVDSDDDSGRCVVGIAENTIADNLALGEGGGICLMKSDVYLESNIIAFNSSGVHAAGSFGSAISPIGNCLHNPDGVNYSGIAPEYFDQEEDWRPDIFADPIFLDRSNGDYHIHALSPCVDSGYGPSMGEYFASDIDGEPRPNNGKQDIGGDECYLPMPTTVAVSIPDAKGAQDGECAKIAGLVVTAQFPGFIYVEASDRSQGIRVVTDRSLQVGTVIEVIGSAGTTDNGERCIRAMGINVADSGSSEIRPIGMKTAAIGGMGFRWNGQNGRGQQGVVGGSGLNNIGLLVRTMGHITYWDSDLFYVDDGSALSDGSGHVGVRVCLAECPEIPIGTPVIITGISSCFQSADGRQRQILVPSQENVRRLDGPGIDGHVYQEIFQEVTEVTESPHPYLAGTRQSWTFSGPAGCEWMGLHLSEVDLAGGDYIAVRDADGVLLEQFASLDDAWGWYETDSVVLTLFSTTGGAYGFRIDGYASGSTIPMSGASIRLDPLGITVQTDAKGHYCFAGLDAGSYEVVPQPPAGFLFDPASRLVEITGPGFVQDADFFCYESYPTGPLDALRTTALPSGWLNPGLQSMQARESRSTAVLRGSGASEVSMQPVQTWNAGSLRPYGFSGIPTHGPSPTRSLRRVGSREGIPRERSEAIFSSAPSPRLGDATSAGTLGLVGEYASVDYR